MSFSWKKLNLKKIVKFSQNLPTIASDTNAGDVNNFSMVAEGGANAGEVNNSSAVVGGVDVKNSLVVLANTDEQFFGFQKS